jgi:hypothetical protein
MYEWEVNKVDCEIALSQSLYDKMSLVNIKLEEKLEHLNTLNVVKDSSLISELDALKDEVNVDIKK